MQMKKYILLFSLLFVFKLAKSQTPTNVTIIGTVIDSASAPLNAATVMLLSAKDSSLLHFYRADEKGNFVFKNVKNRAYQLKISYTGFIPKALTIGPFETAESKLENISLKPITKELMEVVIKTARAPLTMRGDTVEYDARAFKVPEGSTVEDLLRRLPGIEVDASGNIKAQGKDIRRLYVDGKSFFGDDPKMATKNLGAETISKVQVFNEKSEQSKLTGVDDGKREKAINLELKQEYKKGKFGKIMVGSGAGEMKEEQNVLGEIKANYNRFNEKEQFSIIGFGNNVNHSGLSWEEFGEFKGESNQIYDNEDLGFSGGMNWWGGNGDSEGLRSNFDGRGYTVNKSIGANYNYDNKKKKINLNYYVKDNDLELPIQKITENILNNTTFKNTENSLTNNRRINHKISARLQNMIDSSNTIIFRLNAGYRNLRTNLNNTQFFEASDLSRNTENSLKNNTKNERINGQISSIYTHKFKRNKQENLIVTAYYEQANEDINDNYNTVINLLNAGNSTEQIRNISLLNTAGINQGTAKYSMSYTLPIKKTWYLESFYNLRNNNYTTNRNNRNGQTNLSVDSLSNRFKNNILYNRLGSAIRWSDKGKNLSIGLAGLNYGINGTIKSFSQNNTISKISKSYSAITPNVSFSINTDNNLYIGINFNYDITAPNIVDLMPLTDNSNQFFIKLGNPNLSPQREHSLSFDFNKFSMASFAYLYAGISLKRFEDQIVYNQNIDNNFRTIATATNLNGGNSVSAYTGLRFPIIKNKLNINGNGGINNTINPAFINDQLNKNSNLNQNFSFGIDYTSLKLYLNTNYNYSKTNIKYSIQNSQNQVLNNTGFSFNGKWNFAKKWFYDTDFNYNKFKNERFGFNQEIPIWNHSIRKLFGKKNKIEGRLTLVDALNKNSSVSLNGTGNQVFSEIAPTLSRYFMASISYNIKGHIDKLRNGN